MRISGIALPENKRMEIALTAVYGIGRPRARAILEKSGIDFGKRSTELSNEEEGNISNHFYFKIG